MCRHHRWVVLERLEDFWSLSKDEQKRIDDELESEIIHKYYEAQVCRRAPRYWAVLQQSAIPILRKPVWLVSGVWENRDLLILREALMNVITQRDEMFPNTPRPIDFSNMDIELHCKEEGKTNEWGKCWYRSESKLYSLWMEWLNPKTMSGPVRIIVSSKELSSGWRRTKEMFRNLWPYQESGGI
jgi:hypothetical protein